MKIRLYLTLRYLKGRSKLLLSPSNVLSLSGIIIGVFALLIVSSVMNGFSSDMMKRIIETKGEIRFSRQDKQPIANYEAVGSQLKKIQNIDQISPVVHCELLLRRNQYTAFSQSAGIKLSVHEKVSSLLHKIRLGEPDEQGLSDKGIILGSDLSYQLFATIGDTLEVISPAGSVMSAFGYLPKVDKVRVIGIFSTGLPEYDQTLSYISLDLAMDLKNQQGIDFFESTTFKSSKSVQTAKHFNQNAFLKADSKTNEGLIQAKHWSEIDHSLFQAVRIEKTAMFFVLSLMLILSGFNIMNNNIRTISEKKFDISLLKSIGLSEKKMYQIVSNMGLFLGISGTIIGEILALLLILSQYYWQYIQIPIAGFPFTSLPVVIRWQDFLLFGLLAITVSFLSSLIPAKKAMNYNMIQVLRENE
jgi:lipoprotein-releasing system permease protein